MSFYLVARGNSSPLTIYQFIRRYNDHTIHVFSVRLSCSVLYVTPFLQPFAFNNHRSCAKCITEQCNHYSDAYTIKINFTRYILYYIILAEYFLQGIFWIYHVNFGTKIVLSSTYYVSLIAFWHGSIKKHHIDILIDQSNAQCSITNTNVWHFRSKFIFGIPCGYLINFPTML